MINQPTFNQMYKWKKKNPTRALTCSQSKTNKLMELHKVTLQRKYDVDAVLILGAEMMRSGKREKRNASS